MLVDEPLRRRRRRCAEDHIESRLAEYRHRGIEPLEIECAALGFETAPRELRESNHLQTGRGHLLGVHLPALPRPVLREIADTGSGDRGPTSRAVAHPCASCLRTNVVRPDSTANHVAESVPSVDTHPCGMGASPLLTGGWPFARRQSSDVVVSRATTSADPPALIVGPPCRSVRVVGFDTVTLSCSWYPWWVMEPEIVAGPSIGTGWSACVLEPSKTTRKASLHPGE